MNTLLIGYDLNGGESSDAYEDISAAIKAAGAWWHHLDSTWLVRTEQSPKSLRDKLKAFLDSDDELLVVDVTGDGMAWEGFSDRAMKWLRETP